MVWRGGAGRWWEQLREDERWGCEQQWEDRWCECQGWEHEGEAGAGAEGVQEVRGRRSFEELVGSGEAVYDPG